MKRLTFLLIAAALIAFVPSQAAAQACAGSTGGAVCMYRTTFSANVGVTDTTFQVASATGWTVGNFAFADGEQMRITAIASTNITVQRGVNGTRAQAHDSGDGILTGSGAGGPLGAGHFNTSDPDFGQDCSRGAGQASYLPWINVRTGWIWTCDKFVTDDWSVTYKPTATLNSEPTTY